MPHAPIVTVTLNPAVDLSTRAPELVPQRKLRCERPVREPGGGGINVARVVRVLGGEALAVFTSGGVTGSLLESMVAACGVAGHPVRIAGETRENIAVDVASTGALYRFVMPGPSIDADEFACVEEAVRNALRGRGNGALLVISGSMCDGVPPDVFDRVIPEATEKGVRVFVDASGEWVGKAARAGASFLKPNRRELEGFAGRPLPTRDDLVGAAGALLDAGVREGVFVSLGGEGLLAVTRDGVSAACAPPVEVVSTIGAGDSTVAGIALCLAQGGDIATAAKHGAAAGTAACITPGTTLCLREDVESLLAAMG